MQFRILKLTEYRYEAEKKKSLMALIKAKKIFNVVEIRHNHDYLLECEGIRHWFVPYEIKQVRDTSEPIKGEYVPLVNFPPYVITKDGRMGKLVPDFVEVNTNMAGRVTNRRIMVTLYPSNGKKFTKQVAELVLDTFTDQVRNRRVIHYKDGDITNLNVENLEYISRSRALSNE